MRIALTLDGDLSGREENDYVAALMDAGFRREEIVVIPPGSRIEGEFDGIVLGGGVDVDPARYGQAPRPDANLEIDAQRDVTDFELFARGRTSGTPTLGICRGLQVANVALGGTLVQDLASQMPGASGHETDERKRRDKSLRDHAVRVAPGTRLSGIAEAPEISVNSRHHQAIERLAPGLSVSATAPDGVIEAVEGAGPWLLAVQWHPENLAAADAASRRIFEEFARAVRTRAVAASD